MFIDDGGVLRWARGLEVDTLLAGAVWLDLVNPRPEEIARAEAIMGIRLPTREQRQEIEASSRLRFIPGGVVMTVMVLVWADTDAPQITPVTFAVHGDRLATVHDIDPHPFLAFRRQVSRKGYPGATADAVLAGLMDSIVERTAGVLRRVGIELDTLGSRAFSQSWRFASRQAGDDVRTLKRIGHIGQLVAKARESLASLRRVAEFLASGDGRVTRRRRSWARGMLHNVTGLAQYARFLSSKAALLMDTTFGRINIEQSEIIKIVSALTVALAPPTLVASVYGMNFEVMPEHAAEWGYPLALVLMLLAAVIPLWYVRHRRWM
jgi:magnesium transporter